MKVIFFIFLGLIFTSQASYGVNPSEVLISVYSLSVSTNTDCSDPKVAINFGTTAKEFDFIKSPNLGGGKLADGTYPCVIMKMSDIIKFKPAVTSGSCIAGTQYTIDVCRSNGANYTPLTISGGVATLGSTTGCTGSLASPTDDQVPLFLSTASTNEGGGAGSAFLQPSAANGVTNGFKLNGAFTVSGSAKGTFVVNFNDKISGGNADCDLNAPVFGFR